jgi:DNA-binding transcriptional LysR family regulator
VNNANHYASISLTGSNFPTFTEVAGFYSQGYGNMRFHNDGNHPMEWVTDEGDGHNFSATVKMTLTAAGELQTLCQSIIHTADADDDHALEIGCDADDFGDVKAIDIAYRTGAIAAGQDEAVILTNVNQLDATGGTITIGIGEAFASEITGLAVTRLHSMRPEIRINLIEGYSELLLERLREGEFDFVAGGTGGIHPPDDLVHELVYSSDDVVVARAAHPLAGQVNLELKDLQNYTWLVPYSRTSDLSVIIDAFVAERLTPPKRIIGTDAYMAGMHLMLSNDFLFMTAPGLIGLHVGESSGLLEVLDIDRPTVRRHAHLFYLAERPMSPAAAVLLQEVRDACEELAP